MSSCASNARAPSPPRHILRPTPRAPPAAPVTGSQSSTGSPRTAPVGHLLLTTLVDAQLAACAPPLLSHIAVPSATLLTSLELIRLAARWELGELTRSVTPAAAGGTLVFFIADFVPVVIVAEAPPSAHCVRHPLPRIIHRSPLEGA